ncbi:hypothetical protein BCR44DRAFT_1497926 [Catenaria anguillulae PL171]|uniref:RING-type E3 ubiquitin transferase n=1 Tax=Catenaria anguillulae PL171 TaxID=765915 RepID=A0A1Y2HUK3_9FUNG|nr:hypothetical protein BCR44DRAFT_1497926 [Catenaria anguillulae PL171]
MGRTSSRLAEAAAASSSSSAPASKRPTTTSQSKSKTKDNAAGTSAAPPPPSSSSSSSTATKADMSKVSTFVLFRNPFNPTAPDVPVSFVAKSDLVASLRERAADELGIQVPLDRFQMMYLGQILQDTHSLHDYSIDQSSVIQWRIRPAETRLPPSPPVSSSRPASAASQYSTAASCSDAHDDLSDADSDSSSTEAYELFDNRDLTDADIDQYAWLTTPSTPPKVASSLLEGELAEYLCGPCAKFPPLARRPKCNQCGCSVCGRLDALHDRVVQCDQCEMYEHFECAGLLEVPPVKHWFCARCRNDGQVKKAERKTKGKAATAKAGWGRGLACAGHLPGGLKDAVAEDHRGKIPGVLCGQMWENRRLCGTYAVHRPTVAGIHAGKKTGDGALSIVLAGGYEDDLDHGDDFFYTGSGGRDLKKEGANLRTGPQTKDQELTAGNLALARTCHAKVDTIRGAEASDWTKSLPVRVVRAKAKTKKMALLHPFSPEEGVRYDGLYKLVKYWPEKGKSGFIVWRYLFRRDDDEPAPWTDEGKEYVREQGLTMVREASKKRPVTVEEDGEDEVDDEGHGDDENADPDDASSSASATTARSSSTAKKRRVTLTVSDELRSLAAQDTPRIAQWADIVDRDDLDPLTIVELVNTMFQCVVCLNEGQGRMSLKCGHLTCADCLKHMLKSSGTAGKACPYCKVEHGLKSASGVKEDAHILKIFQVLHTKPLVSSASRRTEA